MSARRSPSAPAEGTPTTIGAVRLRVLDDDVFTFRVTSIEQIAILREQFETDGLDVDDLDPDPIAQFRAWYDVAESAGLHQPEAVALSTATTDGRPSARFVLLRGVDERGFAFYTDGRSAKGSDLLANPQASMLVPWYWLQRQVRITGLVSTVSDEESDAYFAGRPRGSQIGAWTSHQSSVLPDRATLDARYAEVEASWEGREVSRPPYWGGFRIQPDAIEFWQGRQHRLHDRLRYRRADAESPWVIERLSP